MLGYFKFDVSFYCFFSITERQQAFQRAIQVQKYDENVDETLGWLEQKEAFQVAMEGEDISRADLAALKQLVAKHNEFMRGVSAVEKQVNLESQNFFSCLLFDSFFYCRTFESCVRSLIFYRWMTYARKLNG